MDETMYESRDACPWYQSTDLDFDAARAEWERDRQAAAYADYCAAMVEIDAAAGDDPWDVEGAE